MASFHHTYNSPFAKTGNRLHTSFQPFYYSPSTRLDNNYPYASLSPTSHQPLSKTSWITFIEPFKNDQYFVLGCAGKQNAGVHVYSSTLHKTLHIQAVSGKVWNGCCSSDGRLLVTKDDGMMDYLKFSEAGSETLKVSDHFETKLNVGRIEQVSFVGDSEDHFVTVERKQLKLWSISKNNIQLVSTLLNVSDKEQTMINCVQTCPHDPRILAVGIKDYGISLVDIREGSHRLSIKKDQDISIASKIKWNPFVPYWLASSSSMSASEAVGIFDLRYESSKPLMQVSAQFTNDFAWSNSNCDILMTASSNRHVGIWSLGKPEGDALRTVALPDVGGDLIQLMSSSAQLGAFNGLSITGKIVKLVPNSELLSSYALTGDDSKFEEVEKALYLRDFGKVFNDLLEQSNAVSRSNFKKLKDLLYKSTPMPPIPKDAWKYNKYKDDEQAIFNKDLKRFSQGIPPNFNADHILIQGENCISQAIDQVRFKVKVLEALQNQDGATLLISLDRINKLLDRTPSFLDREALFGIAQRILLSDERLAALYFVRSIVERKRTEGIKTADADVCNLVRLLFFPTIFDKEAVALVPVSGKTSSSSPSSNKQSPIKGSTKKLHTPEQIPGSMIMVEPKAEPNVSNESPLVIKALFPGTEELLELQRHLGSINQVLSMIDFDIMVEEAHNNDIIEKHKIILEELEKGRHTISAHLIWTALEASLDRSQLDLYFSLLGKFFSEHLKTEFGAALLEYMDKQVLPKLKYILSQAIDTHRPSLVVRAILLVATIVEGLNPLPPNLEPYLIDRLHRLVRAMHGDDYASMGAYSTMVKFIHSMQLSPGKEGIYAAFAQLQRQLVPPPS